MRRPSAEGLRAPLLPLVGARGPAPATDAATLRRVAGAAGAWHALGLLPVAAAQALIESRIGSVSGAFYAAFVRGGGDGGAAAAATLLPPLFARAAGLYAAIALARGARALVTERLALAWRVRLTRRLLRAYCAGGATGRGAFYTPPPVAAGAPAAAAARPAALDNPDQRIAADVAALSAGAAEAAAGLSAAPLGLSLYTFLTQRVFESWAPVAAALAFFAAGAALQRALAAPLAGLILAQERLEGDFRCAPLSVVQAVAARRPPLPGRCCHRAAGADAPSPLAPAPAPHAYQVRARPAAGARGGRGAVRRRRRRARGAGGRVCGRRRQPGPHGGAPRRRGRRHRGA
jgi:hypothetical protein